jgi:hypothetical protein
VKKNDRKNDKKPLTLDAQTLRKLTDGKLATIDGGCDTTCSHCTQCAV